MARLGRTFAWAALWLVVLTGLLIAGGLGHFGETTRSIIVFTFQNIDDFIKAHQDALDRFWKLMGAIGTIASVSLAIYKTWRNLESNFPYRLAEFLNRNDKKLTLARPLLIDAVENGRPTKLDAPNVSQNPPWDMCRSLGLQSQA